jgi:hypothetical protein
MDLGVALGLGRESVRKLAKNGTLPPPIACGHRIRWPREVILPVVRRLRGEAQEGGDAV